MLNLNNEIIENITKPSCTTINISGKKHFVKKVSKQFDGIELVVEKLANLIGINCAHYERIEINNEIYYLSEDISNGKTYVNASQTTRYKNRINDILDVLQELYPLKTVYLADSIAKIFIFDTLIINIDRNYTNWGFLFDENDISDVVILDNELSFNPAFFTYKSDDYILPIRRDVMHFMEIPRNCIYELDEFLESSPYYIELFKYMYNMLTPEFISMIFDEVEKENNISIIYKNIFIKNYDLNYKLIGDRILNKNYMKL